MCKVQILVRWHFIFTWQGRKRLAPKRPRPTKHAGPSPWHTSESSSWQLSRTWPCLSCTCVQFLAPADHPGLDPSEGNRWRAAPEKEKQQPFPPNLKNSKMMKQWRRTHLFSRQILKNVLFYASHVMSMLILDKENS